MSEIVIEWRDIGDIPNDDSYGWVRWDDGAEAITDFDHDSDPAWWRERGAKQWRKATEAELAEFHADIGLPAVASLEPHPVMLRSVAVDAGAAPVVVVPTRPVAPLPPDDE